MSREEGIRIGRNPFRPWLISSLAGVERTDAAVSPSERPDQGDLFRSTDSLRRMGTQRNVDVEAISPLAWRLLRVAAGYEQRGVERAVDDLLQAHVSMLESGTRGLSADRRRRLFDLYAAELSPDQVDALVEHF